MRFRHHAVVVVASVMSMSAQATFTFADIALDSSLTSVAATYPHSTRVGDLLYVSPQDRQQHIGVVELSGLGATRRLRIAFEVTDRSGHPVYPRCDVVQQDLERRYGQPVAVRNFDEERSRRSDRVWQSVKEQMTLVCFQSSGEPRTSDRRAEALIIIPR